MDNPPSGYGGGHPSPADSLIRNGFAASSYHVRFEVLLKNPEDICAKSIIYHIISQLEKTKKNTDFMTYNDTKRGPVPPTLEGIPEDQLTEKFCIKIIGLNNRQLNFGIIITSNISFGELKERSLEYFQDNNVYMRHQSGGFFYGTTQWINIGFMLKFHPTHGDIEKANEELKDAFTDGWENDKTYWTKEKKKEIVDEIQQVATETFDAECSDLPLIIQPNVIKQKSNDGTKNVKTYAACIMTPIQLQSTGTKIMDYIINHTEAILTTTSQPWKIMTTGWNSIATSKSSTYPTKITSVLS